MLLYYITSTEPIIPTHISEISFISSTVAVPTCTFPRLTLNLARSLTNTQFSVVWPSFTIMITGFARHQYCSRQHFVKSPHTKNKKRQLSTDISLKRYIRLRLQNVQNVVILFAVVWHANSVISRRKTTVGFGCQIMPTESAHHRIVLASVFLHLLARHTIPQRSVSLHNGFRLMFGEASSPSPAPQCVCIRCVVNAVES